MNGHWFAGQFALETNHLANHLTGKLRLNNGLKQHDPSGGFAPDFVLVIERVPVVQLREHTTHYETGRSRGPDRPHDGIVQRAVARTQTDIHPDFVGRSPPAPSRRQRRLGRTG